MYECPGDSNYILVSVDGMTFRTNKCVYGDINFVNESNEEFLEVVDVPSIISSKVFGKKRSNIQAIKNSTQCKITISESNGKSHVLISSFNKENVENAKMQVEKLVENAIGEEKFTHFIAVECCSNEGFKNDAKKFLQFVGSSVFVKSNAFDNLNRLHMTLALLNLKDDDEVKRAGLIINKVISGFKWKEDDKMEISGINTFNNINGPRVFYAQPKGSDAILSLKKLQKLLVSNLIKNDIDVVETTNIFHITILKKKWMDPQNWGNSPGQLKQAFEFKMKPAPLKTIALCERLNHEEGKFYKTVTTKDLFT